MADDQMMDVVKRRLSIAVDMRNYTSKDRRFAWRAGTKLGVQILQLDLLPPHVVDEAAELGGPIFFALFILKCVYALVRLCAALKQFINSILTVLDALPHNPRIRL